MSSPWRLSFRLPLLREEGKGHVGATGLSAEPMGHILHICHTHSAQILVHRYTHAQCNPTVTTSISSGPFIMLVAALAKANGMAGLLVLKRGVVRRVEQKAEDGFLIELGWVLWSQREEVEGCLVVTGPFTFHPSTPERPPFSYFLLLLSTLCLTLSFAHCISVSLCLLSSLLLLVVQKY